MGRNIYYQEGFSPDISGLIWLVAAALFIGVMVTKAIPSIRSGRIVRTTLTGFFCFAWAILSGVGIMVFSLANYSAGAVQYVINHFLTASDSAAWAPFLAAICIIAVSAIIGFVIFLVCWGIANWRIRHLRFILREARKTSTKGKPRTQTEDQTQKRKPFSLLKPAGGYQPEGTEPTRRASS